MQGGHPSRPQSDLYFASQRMWDKITYLLSPNQVLVWEAIQAQISHYEEKKGQPAYLPLLFLFAQFLILNLHSQCDVYGSHFSLLFYLHNFVVVWSWKMDTRPLTDSVSKLDVNPGLPLECDLRMLNTILYNCYAAMRDFCHQKFKRRTRIIMI